MVLKLVLECLVEMVFQNSWFFLLFSLKKKKKYIYITLLLHFHTYLCSYSIQHFSFQQVSPGTIFCLGAKTRIVTFFHGSDRKYCCLIFIYLFFLRLAIKWFVLNLLAALQNVSVKIGKIGIQFCSFHPNVICIFSKSVHYAGVVHKALLFVWCFIGKGEWLIWSLNIKV